MDRQQELFPNPKTTIFVAEDRAEPRVWVRRIKIWSAPGDVIREVHLRRGLNIVWSPDPAEEKASAEPGTGIGHGAGKTLFCRLLRYCLGEETFSTDEQKLSIGSVFPDGHVGAEVVINGEPWGVLRPLGTTRRHFAVKGAQPEDLFDQEGRAPGIEPLLRAISTEVLPADIGDNLPSTKDWKSWLLALAWLTRDQECRFDHLLSWRHAQADTRSTVPGLSKDDLATVVRTFLGILDNEERNIQARIDELRRSREKAGSENVFINRSLERMGPQLAEDLGVDKSLLQTDALAATALVREAENRLLVMEEQSEQGENNADLSELRRMLEEQLQQVAILRNEQERASALVNLNEEQIKVIRGERANLDAEELKARLGPVCPVCTVPIELALAEGCGLSNSLPDPKKIADEKERKETEIEAHRRSIRHYNAQIGERNAVIQELDGKIGALRKEINSKESARRNTRREWKYRLYAGEKVVDDALRYKSLLKERDNLTVDSERITAEEKRLKENRKSQQETHQEVLTRFRELFNFVCKGMVGDHVKGKLTLSARGFDTTIANVGNGVAFTSAKAVAFDLAALLMSIEGRSLLPAFVIHDSPREADLGLSIYYRLFNLAADLERIATVPPFQYIVTTTTKPPDRLTDSEKLVLTLRGERPGERLMKAEF